MPAVRLTTEVMRRLERVFCDDYKFCDIPETIMKRLYVLFLLSAITACSGINFSEVNPDAKSFHPKTIAVLPANVGEYDSSRDEIDSAISSTLVKTKWFANVIDARTIKTQIAHSSELADDLSKYFRNLNSFGISDPALTAKLKNELHADALFVSNVTSWGYGRQDGDSVGRVGLSVKLIDDSNGKIMWKAEHELVKSYTFFKPKLHDMTDDLLSMLVKNMPH